MLPWGSPPVARCRSEGGSGRGLELGAEGRDAAWTNLSQRDVCGEEELMHGKTGEQCLYKVMRGDRGGSSGLTTQEAVKTPGSSRFERGDGRPRTTV